MGYSLEAHDRALLGNIEAREREADQVDAAGDTLAAMNDADLIAAYLSTKGRIHWNDCRTDLIETALENMPTLSDAQWKVEEVRLKGLPDVQCFGACRRTLEAAGKWADWRDTFIDDMAEAWLADVRRQAEAEQYS